MTVTVDGLAKIDLAGDLDLLTAECAGIRLRAAIAAGPARTCLDLGQVQFIDAHGLAVLLDTAAFARGNGVHLKVVNINAQPRKIIDVTGTGNALGIT
ncbi:STAS domain-containing protein [Catellatospora bangladeshensis]|uniref:STAS domain-containing protein n=1 Tax=Catellatospora bangladeshensis TaxID=310355 RepID=UPI0019450051|nr:STAS domain-containing protein [Catellatospora bangladeshensis]